MIAAFIIAICLAGITTIVVRASRNSGNTSNPVKGPKPRKPHEL